MSVHLSVCPQGGTPPGQGWGTPPGQGWGTPARSSWGDPTWPGRGGYPSHIQMGGTLARSVSGVPSQVQTGGGTPSNLGWGVPLPGPEGGTPQQRYPPHRVPPWQGVPPQYRAADGVLDTPRSVCLLRSRRRTFLW